MPAIVRSATRPLMKPSARPPPRPVASGVYARRLVAAVDSVPATRGMGVMLIDHGRLSVVRACAPDATFVVVQLRSPSPKVVPGPERIPSGKEWLNLGLNLGGAALSWIGIAGSVAAAPETGGVSLGATVLLYGGATASSLQVVNSVGRLYAVYSGHSRWVTNLDHNAVYTRTSTALDVIGLVGAGGAVKETVATTRALGRAGSSFSEGLGALNRQQRLRLTAALELQGARRVAASRINLVLRLKLLDAFGAAYGTGTSAYGGAVHDLVVFIVDPKGDGK